MEKNAIFVLGDNSGHIDSFVEDYTKQNPAVRMKLRDSSLTTEVGRLILGLVDEIGTEDPDHLDKAIYGVSQFFHPMMMTNFKAIKDMGACLALVVDSSIRVIFDVNGEPRTEEAKPVDPWSKSPK